MNYYYIYFFITSSLGLMRNYIKYKNFKFILFLRSPLINILIFKLLNFTFKKNNNNLLLSIILERWIMLAAKSLISYFKDDYIKKKQKYIKKYNLKY